MVLLPPEQDATERLAARIPGVHWRTVVFSAKEALYKAWFQTTGRWLGFHDAQLRIGAHGEFTADIRIAATAIDGTPLPEFEGRWHTDGTTIVTCVSAV
jgi:4'-phosphopantetheinyl transferase EntD